MAPWIVLLIKRLLYRWMEYNIEVLPILSVIAISYAFGEGTGRLACISFGCCYGKLVSDVHPMLRRIFAPFPFTFTGKTKKIAYAHGLDCQKVIPIQAVTSIIYITAGLVGLHFFFNKSYCAAFIIAILTTQLWRFFSEFLRADYRGERKISVYQIMGIIAFIYAIIISIVFYQVSFLAPDMAPFIFA
jgi:prolipoprotein diacylglyceryltransferase